MGYVDTVVLSWNNTGLKWCQLCDAAQQTQDIESMLVYRWNTVYDAEPMLNQHWLNVLCLLGDAREFYRCSIFSSMSTLRRCTAKHM